MFKSNTFDKNDSVFTISLRCIFFKLRFTLPLDPPYITAGIVPPALSKFSFPEEEISLLVAFSCVINFLKNVIYNRKIKKQANYLNKLDTDVEFEILLRASAIVEATDITPILLLFLIFSEQSIVSVINSFLINDLFILFIASLLSTA